MTTKQPLAPLLGDFTGKDIVSLSQFDRASIEKVFKRTAVIKERFASIPFDKTLANTLAALIFFEPSSRTFLSFATAVKRLGGATIENYNAAATSSVVKGETLEDMGRVLENYADAIIMRHPEIGSVERVANAVQIPVINAGDGSGEHPTQALMDMFTVYEKFGKLDTIKGLIAGDLLYGRTVHSLLNGLSRFKDVTLYLLAPKPLRLNPEVVRQLQKTSLTLIEINSENYIPQDCQFWYWTRVQKERFKDLQMYEQVRNTFIITPKLVKERAGKDTLIMHPLPRVGEIDERIDSDPRAVYLTTQIKNGLYTRMALLELVLGKKKL